MPTYLFDQVISDMKNRERFMVIINDIVLSSKFRSFSFSFLHIDFQSLPETNSDGVTEASNCCLDIETSYCSVRSTAISCF